MKTLTLIMALLLIVVGCDRHNQEEEDAEAEKERLEKELQATAQRIQELCSQYDAVTDWTQSVERYDPYSIELEEALIRADSRPVLLLVKVDNITKKSDKYWVHFTLEAPSTGSYDTDFFLRCTPEQVKEVMRHRHQGYAVIAQVSEIKKISYVFEAYGEVEFDPEHEGYPYPSVTLSPDPLSDLFIAKGTCSALLPVGKKRLYWYELSDLLIGK